MRPLRSFLMDYQKLLRTEFITLYASPVLVLSEPVPDDFVSSETKTFVLPVSSRAAPPIVAPEREWIVYPLVKRPNALFPEQISVGRTRGTDICLNYPDVSNFHAYFSVPPAGQKYMLTDAGSKNGTTVDGVRLAAKKSEVVEDGAQIKFSVHETIFYMPKGFYDLIEHEHKALRGNRP